MKKQTLLKIALLALCCLPTALMADTRYVSASTLNVREQPNVSAKLLAKFSINQQLNFVSKQGDWCEVANGNPALKGFVQCQLLATTPITLAQIEIEAANAVLAINRAGLPQKGSGGDALTINKYDELEPIKALFTQLERHFYYSPSVNTYQLYQELIRHMQSRFNEGENKPLPDEVARLIKTKAAQIPAMQAALSFNPAKNSYAPVTKPITYTLIQLLKKRQGLVNAEPIKPSFFKNGAWSFGWEGGRNYAVKVAKSGQGFEYNVGFDAYGINSLGAVVEMAKHYKVPVKMAFRANKNGGDLTQMSPNFDGVYELGDVTADLPAYAITDKGLVKGLFKHASFAGDPCWADEVGTYAKFIFPKAIEGNIHGFFIASAPVDVNMAKVTVNKKTTHQYLVLTHAVKAQVDIDNDGVADLRTLTSTQQGHFGMNPSPFFAQMLPKPQAGFMRTGGLYEEDVFSLEANHNGQWQTLSAYVTQGCS